MKFKTMLFGLVFVGTAFSQDISGGKVFLASRAQLFKTYTTYTATSDDTTGIVTFILDPLLKTNILLASQVRLLGVSTDSVNADVYVIGTHADLSTFTVTYADSITNVDSVAAGPNSGCKRVITLRAPGVDRLAGMTRFKVGTVFRATLQGTTAGRTLKWYLECVR